MCVTWSLITRSSTLTELRIQLSEIIGRTFNQPMLMEPTKAARTSQAYDGELLEPWKNGSRTLFADVDHIMSYRYFMMFADDGDTDFGVDGPQPVGMGEFPGK